MVEASDLILHRTRIRDSAGYTATIVYVGPVASAKDPSEVYAGVIWDDSSRGKHDGSVISREGTLVRHFSCPHPTGASFLKISKIDTGVALTLELLRSRYVEMNSAERVAPDNRLVHTVRTDRGNQKPIEFYGEVKIRKFQQAEVIPTATLRRLGISSFQLADDWSQVAQLHNLDLAGNLLSDWVPVTHILQAFVNLQSLSLAANRINDLNIQLTEHSSLRSLNLLGCGITTIATVLQIGRAFPALHELCLAENYIQDWISASENSMAEAFQHLHVLDLTKCQLCQAEDIAVWSRLSSIQALHLDENPIDTMTHIPTLQHLQVTHTLFNDWAHVESWTTSLPQLRSLRIGHCPLTQDLGAADARNLVIARLPHLEVLNGSLITNKERHQAERRFLTLPTAQNSSRYQELQAKHKAISPPGTGICLADSIVNISVSSMASSSCTMSPWIRRVTLGLTLGRLKVLLFHYFGLDIDLQQISMKCDGSLPIELDDDSRDLSYYGISDGAELIMDEKTIQKQSEANNQWDAKITQQEIELNRFQEKKKLLNR